MRTIVQTLADATAVGLSSDTVVSAQYPIQTPSDAEIAQIVRATALQMLKEGSPLKICWANLRKRIPELSTTLGQLSRLPLTVLALREVTEPGERAAARRILGIARQWIVEGQTVTRRKLLARASAHRYSESPVVQHALEKALGGHLE